MLTRSENTIQQRWLRYCQRFAATFKPLDSSAGLSASNLGLIVVIPCYNEPDVMHTINALYACTRPGCAVEVLLIINASCQDDDTIHQQNRKTLDELSTWAGQFNEAAFRLHCVYEDSLPVKHQGVGLARKIGLDLAVSRFAEVGNEEGVCVSLDADCLLSENYLCELRQYFFVNRQHQIAVIDFEHRFEEVSDDDHRDAMIAYELYLRYYVQGICYAGLPYGYQTLGSCFAVRAKAYMAQGGMNKRQGGEDFYFIHKFTTLGQCGRIHTTRVMPSARLSQRVPFGTGPAVSRWMEDGSGTYSTYDSRVFQDLRCLVNWLQGLAEKSDFTIGGLQLLPQVLVIFLKQQGVEQRMAEIRANTASVKTLVERFFQWFNAFLALKYIHFAHKTHYQSKPLIASAQAMLREGALPPKSLPPRKRGACPREGVGDALPQIFNGGQETSEGLFDLLSVYRQHDVQKTWQESGITQVKHGNMERRGM
ncbi:MAG: hypothetical protein JKY90_00260 [Gammaproteobacteria bacterium]|nr:hypothetical protein [Gammaproteobacteria bacterium]